MRDPDNMVLRLKRIRWQKLGLPQSVVEEIKRSYQSPTQQKDAYLDTYTHQHPCPSWKKIAEILMDCGLHQQADEVENTYVKGMYVH